MSGSSEKKIMQVIDKRETGKIIESVHHLVHTPERRKIRLIEGNAKCCRLKKLTWKETLRQVLIRLFFEQLVMLVFSTQLFELLPVLPSLWFNCPSLPHPCVKVKYIQKLCG
jgi:hypothetical protein